MDIKIIIYGAGETAKKAYDFVGFSRVFAFAETKKHKAELLGKSVLSFSEMMQIYRQDTNVYIVVASDIYACEMKEKLLEEGVIRYCIFNSSDMIEIRSVLPFVFLYGKIIWRTYGEVLASYRIYKYDRVAIYGFNKYLPYLILEILAQNPNMDISVIADETFKDKILGCRLSRIEDINAVDALIINVPHFEDDIRNQLIEDNSNVTMIDIYDIDKFEYSFENKEMQNYKGIHNGERCFIVATGPSLCIKDLNCLYRHGEICISVNKIYRCYDRTKWRADYVGITDPKVYGDFLNDYYAEKEIPKRLFVSDNSIHVELRERLECINYFHLNVMAPGKSRPLFSKDITKGTYMGGTVTYDFAIQMAIYMGFKKIYLVGVDHSMMGNISDSHNHFIPDYFTDDEKNDNHFNPSNWEGATRAYEVAERYASNHGIKIYNATRGGKLEVFERVDFDSLFE